MGIRGVLQKVELNNLQFFKVGRQRSEAKTESLFTAVKAALFNLGKDASPSSQKDTTWTSDLCFDKVVVEVLDQEGT